MRFSFATMPCDRCHGTRKVGHGACFRCNGSGRVRTPESEIAFQRLRAWFKAGKPGDMQAYVGRGVTVAP